MKCRHSKTFVIYLVLIKISHCIFRYCFVLLISLEFGKNANSLFLLSNKIRYMTFIQQMDLKLKPLALAFICVVVIGFGDTAQQNSNNFLSSYDVQECVCQKMGWEPKCSKQPIKGMLMFYFRCFSHDNRNVF